MCAFIVGGKGGRSRETHEAIEMKYAATTMRDQERPVLTFFGLPHVALLLMSEPRGGVYVKIFQRVIWNDNN